MKKLVLVGLSVLVLVALSSCSLFVPTYGWGTSLDGISVNAKVGDVLTVYFGLNDGSGDSVWGTDVYTSDSSVAHAAKHAGVITDLGGTVIITVLPGQNDFLGTSRNGVVSSSYGSWDLAYSVN